MVLHKGGFIQSYLVAVKFAIIELQITAQSIHSGFQNVQRCDLGKLILNFELGVVRFSGVVLLNHLSKHFRIDVAIFFKVEGAYG